MLVLLLISVLILMSATVLYTIELGIQRRACRAANYPRTVNAGLLWPDVRCVRRGVFGQDEMVKL